jgi:tetratricopeptide (TPR) repeat protein
LPEAAAAYEQALQLRPDDAQAQTNLGVALTSQGQLEAAIDCYRRALRLRPDYADAHNNLGVALKANGKLTDAMACYQRALGLRPDFPEAYNNLGLALCDQGDLAGSVAAFGQALRLRPNYAEAYSNLGLTLKEQGRLQEAVACQQRAIQLRPCADAYINLGNALRDQRDVEGAAAAFREALRLRPDYADAHNALAQVSVEQGQLQEAVRHALEALRFHPDWAPVVFVLAELAADGCYEFPEAQVQRIETLIGDPGTSPSDASLFCFALAMLREKRGDYDDAFASYRQGNALKHRLLHGTARAFDPQKHDEMIDRLIATFTPALVERVGGFGPDTELPVFIVGMPRSGTSLVEQILSRHPLVFAAGELKEIGWLADSLPARLGAPEGYPRCVDRLDQATAQTIAQEYLQGLARRARQGGTGVAPVGGTGVAPVARVTDKAPLNFFHLGLLASLLPRARVIHCRRDPRDVCLSCYLQFFRELNFTWDLGDLGRYYRAYERLMEHWRRVLPVQPLEVDYEQLVTQPEPMIRQLLAFCGLEWDDRCLRSHESPRPVQTMSKLQVRRPIYTTSVGRWRRYEAQLGPLLESLHQE